MSLRHSLKHFYSVIQRQRDGLLILGASRTNPNISAAAVESRLTTDDRAFNAEIADDAISHFAKCFPVCAAEKLRHGEGLQHVWTGIIGMTADSVPFVGAVDQMPGQFVCAGFNGHGEIALLHPCDFIYIYITDLHIGMARIFTCAPGLVKLVLGGAWADTGLPECFNSSKERLERLSGGVSASVF
jgi:hypothetical protein